MNECLYCGRPFEEEGEFCTTYCENFYWSHSDAAERFKSDTAKRITAERVHELLKKAVELKGPDYVYEKDYNGQLLCRYAKDGRPDCIVGHVLAWLGVPLEEMEANDDPTKPNGELSEGTIGGLFWKIRNLHGITFTRRAHQMLSRAQADQDGGISWGYALKAAEELMLESQSE